MNTPASSGASDMMPVTLSHPLMGCGSFGVERKHDMHTGVDFYCEPGSRVFSLYSGEVVDVFQFTGEAVGSPWWNDTQAVVVKSGGLIFVYGEVRSAVEIGQQVSQGQCLGYVRPVLKKDKGVTPTCMLHLEVWVEQWYIKNCTWRLGDMKPTGLLNPMEFV